MGVPKFYRSVSERYPLINQAVDESSLLPEFDNLYLDMNGIIHTATHGNDGVSKKLSERDVILIMMAYIDQMVKIIKPARLLYMAIDGVAPRAKMNQQRSRRFRAARDLAQARAEAAARGDEVADDEVFDSNCITPGTEFMATISSYIKFFVRRKLKEDPLWQRIAVVFSGHEVPGEGEHKIVQYIRAEKALPGYAPNVRHCMAGLDADLIMLSLATHEPHFCLLREQVDFNSFRQNKFGTKTRTRTSQATKWQLLHIGVLREYLEIDMRPAVPLPGAGPPPFSFDGERAIDDFVLLAALCGNDFMPHLPSLDIGEGALDALLKNYRENLYSWGGYLNEGGLINMARLEALLTMMGRMEATVFRDRAAEAERFAQRAKKEARRDRSEQARSNFSGRADGDGGNGVQDGAGAGARDDPDDSEISAAARAAAESDLLASVARRLAAERRVARVAALGGGSDSSGSGSAATDILSSESDELEAAEAASDADGADGADVEPFVLEDEDFKGRYYLDKFGITYQRGSAQDDAVLEKVVQCYVEALQWVLLYYYRGRPSWGWFFPFHFAPMTSDLHDLGRFRLAFRLGQPFRPFQQLLGCLPAASSKFLPAPYRSLMTEASSPLIHFYPPVEDIKVDMNGKRNPWEGVTLIPFIKERDMMAALASHCPDSALSPEELRRNAFGVDYIYRHDPSAADTLASPNAAVFPDLTQCCSRQEVFHTPLPPVLTVPGAATVEEDAEATIDVVAGFAGSSHLFSTRPRAGCVVPAPGFPSLHSLRFAPSLQPVRIDIFGSASRKDSVILRMLGSGGDDGDQDDDEAGGGEAYVPTFSTDLPNLEQRDLLSTWREGGGGRLPSVRAAAPHILGRVVFCDWPHLRAGLVVGVSDAAEECLWADEPGTGGISVRALSSDEQVHWAQEATALRQALRSGGRGINVAGLQLGAVELLLTVRRLEGMRRNVTDGSLSRVFAAPGSDGEVRAAPQLVLAHHPSPDARFAEQGPQTLADRFPLGTPVVVLRGPGRGALATVAAVPAASADTLELESDVPTAEPPFGANIRDQIFDAYFDGHRAAQVLHMSDRVFAKVTGSVLIKGGHGPRATVFDAGLNIKVQRNLFLPGYVRPVANSGAGALAAWAGGARPSAAVAAASPRYGGGRDSALWEYTERAVHLVAAYQREFPAVFAMLDGAPDAPAYDVRDVPGQTEGVVRVMTWLQQLETFKRPLVPLSTQILSPKAIEAIEVAAARWAQVAAPKVARGTRLAAVPASHVFRPEVQAYAVGGVGDGEASNLAAANVDGPEAVPVLGDRVANLSFRQAPLGARATVVGIHYHSGYVECVFDVEFVGGSTLGGQCSNGKGALVPWSALLCLSRLPGEAASAVPVRGASSGFPAAPPQAPDRFEESPGGRRGKVAPQATHAQLHSPPPPPPQQLPPQPQHTQHQRQLTQQARQQQQQKQQSRPPMGPRIASGPGGVGFGAGAPLPPHPQPQLQQPQLQQPQLQQPHLEQAQAAHLTPNVAAFFSKAALPQPPPPRQPAMQTYWGQLLAAPSASAAASISPVAVPGGVSEPARVPLPAALNAAGSPAQPAPAAASPAVVRAPAFLRPSQILLQKRAAK